jgi:hypothetical protein
MKMFIKRFWGFGPHWPIISFGQRGSLDGLLAQSESGDLMAFVGTLGDQTASHERGRLLGIAEFGRSKLHSREALPADTFASAAKGSNGDIKWPHAVVMTRAWKFTDTPLPVMTEIVGHQLSMAAMSNAILLSSDEQSRILSLAREEINVAVTKAIWDEREKIAAAVGSGGTMGPIPASFASTIVRDALKEASTYAYRFGTKNVWKVGWAHDPAQRLGELNKHVPSEVLDNNKWGNGWIQKWASAAQAYAMEQKVLASFVDEQKYGERVHCTPEAFEAAWRKAWKG